MEQLKKKCDDNYHNKGVSLISDYEYDILENYLKNNLNKSVKNVPASKGRVKLPIPMWSLNKFRELSDKKLNEFSDTIVMDKLDGVSCLLYKGRAYTRGNGEYGTDITNVMNKIHNINGYAIRGELVVKKRNLQNQFINTRTMVCSFVTRNESSTLIDFLAYELISIDEPYDKSPQEQLKILKQNKVPVVFNEEVIRGTLDTFKSILSRRINTSDYDIDGLVVTSQTMKRSAKTLQRNPLYSFAFKQNISGVETNVIDIIWNVGKSGTYHPVLIIDSIVISGSTIKKVTGHNINFLKNNKIGIGSRVEIIKSGHVIPHVLKVLSPSDNINFITPDDIDIERNILIKKLLHFVKVLKIKGIGPMKAEEYIDNLITAETLVTKGVDVVCNHATLSLGKNNIKIIESLKHKISNCTEIELLTALCFYGDGIGLKKMELKDLKKDDKAQELLSKWRTAWNVLISKEEKIVPTTLSTKLVCVSGTRKEDVINKIKIIGEKRKEHWDITFTWSNKVNILVVVGDPKSTKKITEAEHKNLEIIRM